MEPVYINGNRDGYSTEQCDYTLTVGELVGILEGFDNDRPVYIRNDNGYTYGSIHRSDISPNEDPENV